MSIDVSFNTLEWRRDWKENFRCGWPRARRRSGRHARRAVHQNKWSQLLSLESKLKWVRDATHVVHSGKPSWPLRDRLSYSRRKKEMGRHAGSHSDRSQIMHCYTAGMIPDIWMVGHWLLFTHNREMKVRPCRLPFGEPILSVCSDNSLKPATGRELICQVEICLFIQYQK